MEAEAMSMNMGEIFGSNAKDYNDERMARCFIWSFFNQFGTPEHRLWVRKINDISWPKAKPNGTIDIDIPVVADRTLTEEQLLAIWKGSETGYQEECRCHLENIAREDYRLAMEVQQLNNERAEVVQDYNRVLYGINSKIMEQCRTVGYYDEMQYALEVNSLWNHSVYEICEIDRRIAEKQEEHNLLEMRKKAIWECQQYFISNVRYQPKVKNFVVTVRKR